MSRRVAAVVALLFAAALLPAAGCRSPSGSGPLRSWSITVDNRTGIVLGIELDGSPAGTVGSGARLTIPGVAEDSHRLDAFDADGRARASRSLYLDSDFVWLLE